WDALSSWTLASKVTLVCIGMTMLQNNLYGLLPCRYSFRRRRFIISEALTVYCFVAATGFGVCYVSLIWREYLGGRIDPRDAIKMYSYTNALVVLLNYVTQWAIMRQILQFLNDVPLFRTINYFSISLGAAGNAVLLALVKMLAFPLLMQVTLVLYQRVKQPELSWIHTSATMIPIVMSNQINNCFFSCMVIARLLLLQVNERLHDILAEVNRLQTPGEMLLQKPYYRMQRFCELADRLDELASMYTLVTSYCRGYLLITSFSLVMSLAVNLFSTTLGCYTQYQAFADYIMTEESYDVARALANFVFLAVPFFEIILLARVSEQVISEAKDAGNLLQRISLQHADIRFKQVVDAFWLQVCTIKFKLMPMGLLELDGMMVNKMYSTVAGFLLFLIQNDLTLRFSLK
ncbi:hypothetical protein KR222_006714, partial [Zaprionus bogoriensis]